MRTSGLGLVRCPEIIFSMRLLFAGEERLGKTVEKQLCEF